MYRVDVIQKWAPTEDDDGTVGRLEYVATSDRTIREWVTDHHEQATGGGDDTAVDNAINWLRLYLLENAPKMDSAQRILYGSRFGVGRRAPPPAD
jgi:hypothetical protein